MKALTTLTALILSIATLTVSAKEDVKKVSTAKAAIQLPAMTWGQPEEVDFSRFKISMPEMTWGSAEEVSVVVVKATLSKISLPMMNWGKAEDINAKDIAIMNIKMPEMNWGSADDKIEL